jgi:hypothetical protein
VQKIVQAYERYNELNGTGRQLALRLEEPPVDASPTPKAAAPETSE